MEKLPILIIDDDAKVCNMVAEILGSGGSKVHVALDGSSGIEIARAVQPAVILLDMMMPGLDGIETCERLKRDPALQDIPVVGVTGSTDLSYTEKAFRAGAEFFLPKPFGAESLVQVVELAAESAHPETPMRRRRHPRFPVELPVRCLVRGEAQKTWEVVGHTKKVGLGGFLLLLPEKVEPGTVLRLLLDLADGPVPADGTVVWQDPQPTSEGKTAHGMRLLRFVEDGDLVQYRRYLSQVAASHAATTSGMEEQAL